MYEITVAFLTIISVAGIVVSCLRIYGIACSLVELGRGQYTVFQQQLLGEILQQQFRKWVLILFVFCAWILATVIAD